MSEPRIPPRPKDDWDAEMDEALEALRSPGSSRKPGEPRRERPSSNILGIFAWHPALARAWFTFNTQLSYSTLTGRDREMATVRIAWLRRGEYEWAQHVRMAKLAGLSQEEVDAIMEKALAAGGTEPKPAQDYGFMYSRDIDDPDGNSLGFLYMVPEAAEKGPEAYMAEQGAAS